MKDCQVVILAGGLGTRLRPLTLSMPKPMIEVAGKPFLEHQMLMLKNQGFRRMLLLTGYKAEAVENYFGDGTRWGLEINYSKEKNPLGTGGGLKLAGPFLDNIFMLLNGDSYLPINYVKFLNAFNSSSSSGLLSIYDAGKENLGTPGNIELNGQGRILAYSKKRSQPAPFVDAGASCWRRQIIDLIPPGKPVSLEEDIYPGLIREGTLAVYKAEARFYDIGTPERVEAFEQYLKTQGTRA
ncbi:MAG: nucleotidyltransferase family protein [Elusimicrobia bacterium]|nr:nucleotidyltransferase family protein [Elusimicrobiota bacterium]